MTPKRPEPDVETAIEIPAPKKMSKKAMLNNKALLESVSKSPSLVKKPDITPGIFITILVLLASIIFSFTFSTKSSNNIQVVGPMGVIVNLEITSMVFSNAYTISSSADYCNNTKEFPGISAAKVQINDSTGHLIGSATVGDAVLYSYALCQFKAFVPLSETFKGGMVSVFVTFPFGQSETFNLDVGDVQPYKIDLKLNLN